MSHDPWERLRKRPCKYLRAKEMFYDTGLPAEDDEGDIFWCTRTHNCLGPDHTPASREQCAPGRECYQR